MGRVESVLIIFSVAALVGCASAIFDLELDVDEKPIIGLPAFYDIANIDEYLDENITNIDRGTECRRTCIAGDHRICYYKFFVEHYQAMGAACGNCANGNITDCFNPQCVPMDGIEKNVMSINRRIPGPPIEVCVNDVVVVDVINLLHAETFSMHWHGILQKGTPYSDGVPYATQCPIQPYTTFRYRFQTPDKGTYFYHSHSGVQRNNGAFGALTVRAPLLSDSSTTYYDKDIHSVVLADWSHTAPELFMTGNPTRPPGLLPEAVLINGKGRYISADVETTTPYEVFYVTSGLKYRFRFVDAGSSVCPMQIQFQNHSMTLITTDAFNVNPKKIDTLVITTGERYDVVISANQPPGIYWLHVKLIGACTSRQIVQGAMLVYGQPLSVPQGPVPPPPPAYAGYSQGITFNDMVVPCDTDPSYICLENLKAPESPDLWSRKPDLKLYWTFTVKQMDTASFFNKRAYIPFFTISGHNVYMGTMNDVSLISPSSPVLSQPEDVDYSTFCVDGETPEYCDQMQICACTQLVDLPLGGLVEIVLIDQAANFSFVVHPIHIHGHSFAVVSQGSFPNPGVALSVETIKQYEAQGLLKGSNNDPPMKDTVTVHNQGFAVIRLVADNPGVWLTHCHVEDHMAYGMGLILRTAGHVPPVPEGFPKCGSFY